MLKSAQPVCICRGPGQLSQLIVKFGLHTLALPVTPNERLIGLGEGIGRNDQLYAPLFAQAEERFATGMLLLKQGEFKYEVGFYVNVHTTTSYARRPSLTAVSKPDSTSHFCPLPTCSGT